MAAQDFHEAIVEMLVAAGANAEEQHPVKREGGGGRELRIGSGRGAKQNYRAILISVFFLLSQKVGLFSMGLIWAEIWITHRFASWEPATASQMQLSVSLFDRRVLLVLYLVVLRGCAPLEVW